MKLSVFLFCVLLSTTFIRSSFSSEIILEINENKDELVLTAKQLEDIAFDLKHTASEQPADVQKSLLKVSDGFLSLANDVEADTKKKKRRISFKKLLLETGKGASFLSTNMLRPFVNIASFFTGLFENPGKNADSKAFLEFFLNHEKELRDSWRNTGTVISFAEKLTLKVENIFLEKQIIMIGDIFNHYVKVDPSRESILKSIGVEPFVDDEKIKTLQEIAFESLGPEDMFFEIDPDLINEHPEYQELRPLLGDISGSDLDSIMTFRPEFDLLSLGNRSRLQLHEGLLAFSAKIFAPKIIIGLVSKSISSVVTGVGLLADATTAASVLMCTVNKKVKKKLKQKDEQLVDFCSYVVNKSAYVLSRSRARGYVSGKNFRRTLIKKTEKIRRKLRRKKKKKKDLN